VTISIYDICIPVLTRGLTNLSALLEKAASHAAARKFDPAVLAQARRLAGVDIPKHADTETTLEELQQRIAKTLDFVRSVKADQMKDAESRAIEIKFPNRTVSFTGLTYLTNFALPNFFFHESMAYALLRSNGVEVGKMDFLGSI
jgi:hypothetical protein